MNNQTFFNRDVCSGTLICYLCDVNGGALGQLLLILILFLRFFLNVSSLIIKCIFCKLLTVVVGFLEICSSKYRFCVSCGPGSTLVRTFRHLVVSSVSYLQNKVDFLAKMAQLLVHLWYR